MERLQRPASARQRWRRSPPLPDWGSTSQSASGEDACSLFGALHCRCPWQGVGVVVCVYSAAFGLGVHLGLFTSAVAWLGYAAQAAVWAPRIEGIKRPGVGALG